MNPWAASVSFTAWPSQAIVRTTRDLILVKVRSGFVSSHEIDTVEQIGYRVEHGLCHAPKGSEGYQTLHLRAVWFDDAHGSGRIIVELLHDRARPPVLTAAEIENELPISDLGIMFGVYARITPVLPGSDHFFSIADEWYEPVRKELGWRP